MKQFTSQFTLKEIAILKKSSLCLFFHRAFEIRMGRNATERTKLLMVIPKKVGNAPYRNYLKRCIRIVFRSLAEVFAHRHVVVFIKKYEEKLLFRDITVWFQSAVQKKNSLKAAPLKEAPSKEVSSKEVSLKQASLKR